MTVREGLLGFKIARGRREGLTSFSGLPVLIESFRLETPKPWYRRLRDAIGATQGWKRVRAHIESLVCLIASGGDCIDDLGDGARRRRAAEAASFSNREPE